jgi:hypothetical protein
MSFRMLSLAKVPHWLRYVEILWLASDLTNALVHLNEKENIELRSRTLGLLSNDEGSHDLRQVSKVSRHC